MINALYLTLLFAPIKYWRFPLWERFLQLLFLVSNCIALLFEISDWAYFPFNFKRATADVLRMVSSQGDFWSVLPSYLVQFWFVPLAVLVFACLLIFANRQIVKLSRFSVSIPEIKSSVRIPVQLSLLLLVSGTCLVGIRGGLQYIPIGIRNAIQVTESKYVPIVLNTPFSIITTLATPALEPLDFMPAKVAEKEMPFRQHYTGKPFQKKNVVVLIIESGSKEFTALGNGPSFTPFLDSLMGASLVCTQGFANGQTSAEGIPAILAGIPTLMDEAFTTSAYGTNNISALPNLLQPFGYTSAFFHGGTNGTMSFDIFAAAAGFQKYFGRKEYNNEQDYDGAWGIRDIPFLHYAAQEISKLKTPFFSSIFTLSAHPPYGLPEHYRATLPKGPLAVQQCLAYTDLALREFFKTAANTNWFANTLFVITSDHCSPKNGGGFYAQGLGQYAIPILFYAPGDSSLKGYYNLPVQQLDILPSVLDYLGYPKPFFAFGNSMFDKQAQRFVITQNNGSYQWLQNGYLLKSKVQQAYGLYQYPSDSMNRQNLLKQDTSQANRELQLFRAFLQRYRQVLLENKMS